MFSWRTCNACRGKAAENGNTYLKYVFSQVKCRRCPLKENCRVGKSKAKERRYSITQVSHKNQERLEFEASEMFKERMKIRHRIEEKNGELKEAHGLRRADSKGLFAMRLQMYFTAFTVKCKKNREAGRICYDINHGVFPQLFKTRTAKC